MKTLREFVEGNPLGSAEAETKRQDGLMFFGEYLSSSASPTWFRVLSKFTKDSPLRYWDREKIEKALALLELDVSRTVNAIDVWKNRIGIGFDYLFRRASIERYEEDLSISNATDLLLLANELHPEYLRRCEFIFTNLIIIYWALMKKGTIKDTGFDITGASSMLKSKGYGLFLSGYDERMRNGIAHGQVTLGFSDIQYGHHQYPHKLQIDEFLYLFDSLWRTSNSLAIAILLFIARNYSSFSSLTNTVLPVSIISLIAAAETEREGLSVKGVFESEIRSSYQLHILIETVFHKRESVLLECALLAMRLLDAGATGYSRYVFGIHQAANVDSMIIILPEKLIALQNEPYTRFSEVLETDLIWTKESTLQNRMKAFRIAFVSNAKLEWSKFLQQQQSKGLFLTANRYYIKRIKNSSAGGIARAHVFISLRFPADADNPDLVRQIIADAIKKVRRKRFETNPSNLIRTRRNWQRLPKYIWVSLYKYEGTTRWVVYGGWLRRNLIAVAERIYDSTLEPIFVKKPDESWKNIRFKFSIDIEAGAKSFAETLKLAED